MQTLREKQTPRDKLLFALGEYGFLTLQQLIAVLGYKQGSRIYVLVTMKALVNAGDVLSFGGRGTSLPVIYTLSGNGRRYVFQQGKERAKRFRLAETRTKADNGYFPRHTLAVNDVLIAARLLSRSIPAIELVRVYHERDLRRKIAVALPGAGGKTRQVFLEPDAALDVRIRNNETVWRDFVNVEVYRHHPMEQRFKQKIAGYVAYASSPQHETLFHTKALTIALFCETPSLVRLLKGWTEQVLTQLGQKEEGERFFFSSIPVSEASPTDVFLSPVWEQAFSTTTTPLLMLE
jgi:protein involved in plasmid replication-relaxation